MLATKANRGNIASSSTARRSGAAVAHWPEKATDDLMRRRALWLTVLLLTVAAAVRAWHLDTQSIWFDEGFSWHAATQPDLLATLNGDPTNPPLYYLLLHIWVRLLGDSEFALRSLSLLQGILLLALMGMAARRWFGTTASTTAVAIGAWMPLLWWASQEARMYNTLALAVLVLALGLTRVLADSPAPLWAWLAALGGELAALYTHNTGVVVLGAANVVALTYWVVTALGGGVRWRLLGWWLAGQVAVGILWLPELLARFLAVSAANVPTSPPPLTPSLLWDSWQTLWASSWDMMRAGDSSLQVVAALLLPLPLMGLRILPVKRGRLLVGFIASLYIVLIAALSILGVNMHGRYLVMIAPLLVIAVAAGTARLARPLKAGYALPVGAVLAVALAWAWLPGRPNPAYQHDQARDMVAYYARTLGPDDRVLAWSYAERYDLLYYWERMGVAAQMVTLPEGAEAEAVVRLINASLPGQRPARVEVNTWFTQRADARGMLPCLLGNDQPAPTDTFTVYGMATTAYAVEAPLLPLHMEAVEPVDFGPLRLDRAHVQDSPLRADHGMCLPVELTLTQTVNEDFRAAANILNPLGREFAGDDAPLLTAAQTPTSRLSPGQTVQAYLLLYLPQGTPPGIYPLRLRLYSEGQPSGLDVRDPASGAPAGRDTPLGTLELLPGEWEPFAGSCALPVGAGVTLTNCDELSAIHSLAAGETLYLTLRWQIDGPPPEITLALSGDGWQVADAAAPPLSGTVLDWRALRVPAEASGSAILTAQIVLGEAVRLAEYTVERPEHRMSPPEVDQRSGTVFPGVGTLYGFSMTEEALRAGEPIDVTLVWHAQGATEVPYTVTVQLLSETGALLAQHDAPPANGARPTTGWVPGEYILDAHRLAFRDEAAGYHGPATLIVALYNPRDGTRVASSAGPDHAILSTDLTIGPR